MGSCVLLCSFTVTQSIKLYKEEKIPVTHITNWVCGFRQPESLTSKEYMCTINLPAKLLLEKIVEDAVGGWEFCHT